MLRVITGAARGAKLVAPPTRDTRPMTDKLKEALFAALGPAGGHGKVLDLYAGSGQLGIEALSRGAEHVDFMDAGALACRTIARNLEHVRFTDRGTIWRGPLPRALHVLAQRGGGPYDLVLVDPPYIAPEFEEVLAILGTGTLLAEEAWVAIQHTKRREFAEVYGRLARVAGRRHGDNVYAIYRYQRLALSLQASPPDPLAASGEGASP